MDVKKECDKIVISIDEYAKIFEKLEIREGRWDEVLTDVELMT